MKFKEIEKLMQKDMQKVNDILTSHLNSNIVLINHISNYIISSGGKRLRPMLLLLITNALNYQGNNQHLMASVIELIHTATLLHDDVVDESSSRRGAHTVNKEWGNAAAVLVGDFLYSRSFEIMVKPNNMKIMQIMSKATNKITEGEVMQLLNCGNIDLSTAEYFAIIERKTACLFEAACRIAGLLADDKNSNNLAKFGINLGNAFQIIDDILDYKSNKNTMGKEAGNDLAEGKITLPLIYALQNTSDNNREIIVNAVKSKNNNIIQIIDILDKCNAFDYANSKAKEYANLAKSNLDFMDDSKYKNSLIALCDLSLERKF